MNFDGIYEKILANWVLNNWLKLKRVIDSKDNNFKVKMLCPLAAGYFEGQI